MSERSVRRLAPLLLLGALLAACSGSGGGGASAGFQLTRISLQEGSVWRLNQEIVFTFNDAVDLSSVNLNTINIQTLTGAPASGSFFLRTPSQVVFQPTCPTLDNLSDTGLVAFESYAIVVPGRSSGAVNTVRSTSNARLEVTQVRNFTTPATDVIANLFLDTVPGAPVPIVRPFGSVNRNATHLEVGGDPDNTVYFERAPNQDLVLSVPGFEAPLNLFSDPATRLAFVIEFNQAVNPSSTNISSNRVRLEFQDSLGEWQPLETLVTLVANCTETGAVLRLEPLGLLPRSSMIRAVVNPGFQDLVGTSDSQPRDDFAIAPTRTIAFTSLSPAGELSDELPEGFDFGGGGVLSNQDTTALFGTPTAAWGSGRLSAAFSFGGSGGPGGDFDWVIQSGEVFLFDTSSTTILSSNGTVVQNSVGGVVDLRNMTIEAGGTLRVRGPNRLLINATGDVILRGTLDASGANASDVILTNTGGTKESGGVGGPGGGRGGDANEVVTNSTPRGGSGQGPGVQNGGGQGGETGFAPESAGKDARRPGGGGGGRFARDQGAGLLTENGVAGNMLAKSAITPTTFPAGGAAGVGPFVDGDNENDFFGTHPVVSGGQITRLVRGELPSLWAGYGGGGGGNADPSNSFPTPNWTAASDEKGGAGGGGGGGVHIRALGRILFGTAAQLRCNGGRGGLGENTLGQDHVGGSGGSGSGGHVILETASFVDFTDGGAGVNATLRDWVQAVGGPRVTGTATPVDPVSFGGAGGPGVIQIHVPNTVAPPTNSSLTSDIVVPNLAVSSGNALDAVMSPAGIVIIPGFGSTSNARSKWISLGGADQQPNGIPSQVRFLFEGTQKAVGADEGKILSTAGAVDPLAPVLDENLEGSATVSILPDRRTLEVRGSSLDPLFNNSTSGVSNDIYLRNPALLEDFVLRLDLVEDPDTFQDFVVAAAAYLEGASGFGDERLRMTIADDGGGDLQAFFDANVGLGTVHYRLVPRFFRVLSGGNEDQLPPNSFIRVRFQAAADDGSGNPDEQNLLVDWTGDISQFNALPAGDLQFFRFEIQFELDTLGMGVSSDTPGLSLDFLRVPFVF